MIRTESKAMAPVPAPVVSAADILPPFDYAALRPDQAALARDAVPYIEVRQRGMASAAIEIGAKFNEVKAALEHGQFTAWLSASFSMTARTARNYMVAASALGAKRETVSVFPVTTVYELARAPLPIREQVLEEIETARTPVPAKEVSTLIWQAQQTAKEAARIAKLSPAARKREKEARQKAKAAMEADRIKSRQEEANRERATVRLAELLIERLGDDIGEAADLLSQTRIDGRNLARRLSGELYGADMVAFRSRPRTKDDWLALLAKLDAGENPLR